MRRGSLVAAHLCLAFSLLSTASADADGAAADSALSRGVALRREHRDADALGEFRRAYAIAPTPRALAQIALAEAALEQWVNAEADLLRALGSADDPWIARQHAALRTALDEIDGHLATLEVVGQNGAQLWIDGALTAELPRPVLRVPARRVKLELRAAGYATAVRDVELLPGRTVSVTFALEPTPPSIHAEPPGAIGGPPQAVVAQVPTTKAGRGRTAAWIAAGGGAVFAAAGTALLVYAGDRAAHYNDNAECADEPGLPRSVRCASYRSQVYTAETAEIVSYGLSLAALTTSAFLFLRGPHDAPLRAHLDCRAALGGASCVYVF